MKYFALAFIVFLSARIASAGAAGPTWNRQLELSDGRTFVTDGAFTIDAAIAKPAELPKQVVPGKIIEVYLAASLPNEYAVGELSSAGAGTYRAPSGVVLNALYVDYLRSVLPDATLRFRMKGDLDPVVILSDRKAVGVVMPMKR